MPLLLPVFLLVLQAVLTVHTELVVVPVVVTNAQGGHVTTLTQDDFHVYEDGRSRPVVVFQHGEAPITLGMVVDRSQSMRPKSVALATAVSAVLQVMRKDDEVFAVDFNDHVSFELPDGHPFTRDPRAMAATLAGMASAGQTALYDGVAAGLAQLRAGHAERQALVVISDGGDNASRHTYADVLAIARRSDAVVYAIGLVGPSPDEADEDEGVLTRLCHDTGGVAYFPKTTQEIAAVSARIAADLREQYTLGFEPAARAGARAFRKIEVRVTATGHGRLHVRTRSGYLVENSSVTP
ncbi:MAG TPA: VWA domain-containing protein [Vicinamibacterales bacterium]|nr:VWA domain-containing protein [Vicinamibacterales bacterium]